MRFCLIWRSFITLQKGFEHATGFKTSSFLTTVNRDYLSHSLLKADAWSHADAPLLKVQEWKGPMVEDGGKNPKWKEDDPKNIAEVSIFLYS